MTTSITQVDISNFGIIENLSLDLTTSAVHLIAGFNESGKTTIRDAVRYALIGETFRLNRKGDYKKLLSYGQKRGKVTVKMTADDAEFYAERAVHDHKRFTGETLDVDPVLLDIALGFRRFTDLSVNDRRALLFMVTGIDPDVEAICTRMSKRGIGDTTIDRFRPLLARGGMEVALKEAKTMLSDKRGAWQEVTGDNFGSEKAADWHEEHNIDDAAIAATESRLVEKNAERNELIDHKNILVAEKSERANIERTLENIGDTQELRDLADKADKRQLDTYTDRIADMRKEANAAVRAFEDATRASEQHQKNEQARKDHQANCERLTELQADEERLKKKMQDLADDNGDMSCPACSTVLRVSDNHEHKLVGVEYGIGHPMTKARREYEDVMAELRPLERAVDRYVEPQEIEDADLASLEEDAQLAVSELAQAEAAITELRRAEDAAGRLQQITTLRNRLDELKIISAIDADLEQIDGNIVALSQAIGTLENEVKDQRQQRERCKRAYDLYGDWLAIKQVVEAFEPSGIQAEIIGECLGEINRQVYSYSMFGTDAKLRITEDMDIYRGDEPYSLLSESAQWRTDVTVHMALLAIYKRIGFIFIDRVDVLDINHRPELVDLCEGQPFFENIVLTGTFARPPQVAGVECYWIEDGSVKPVKAEAA